MMESKKNIHIHQLVSKIEIKQEPCLLETTTEVKSDSEATCSENHIKYELPSAASNCIVQCNSFMQGDDEICPKIEIKEEPIDLESISTEEKSDPKVAPSSGNHIKNESASDFIVQCKSFVQEDGADEMCTKMEIKEESICSKSTSTKGKSESEVAHSFVNHIKNGSASSSSDFIAQPDSFMHTFDHEIHTKIEIKEEPICMKRTSTEATEIHLRAADLDFDAEDNALQEDQDFTEVTRLEMETVCNYESDITSAGVDKVWLKRRENSSHCHKESNTATAYEFDITHVGDTLSHKCKFCGKCFSQPSDLQTHIVTHEGERKHKCNVCHKSYAQASQLKEHISIHGDKRPHKCNICYKSFSLVARLKQHILIHERLHKCNICNQRFPSVLHLKTHVTNHKIPHKCNICDKSFPSAFHLKAHVLIHERIHETLFKCDRCDRSYLTATLLRAHKLFHY